MASERRETSYYEVALTNRQVVGVFAILLVGLFVSFLAGVWVGRGEEVPASPTLRLAEAEAAERPATQPALNEVEKLDFFSGEAEQRQETEAASPPATAEPPSPEPASTPPPAPSEERAASPAPADSSAPTPRVTAVGESAGGPGVPKWRHRGQVAREAEELEQEFANEEAELRATPPARLSSDTGATPAAPAPTGPKPEPKPATQPAPLSGPAVPPAKGVFVVQVFSSSDAAKARGILDALKDAGFPAMLLRNEQVTPAMYRVRVGPYRDRPAAEKAAEELRSRMRVDTWITAE